LNETDESWQWGEAPDHNLISEAHWPLIANNLSLSDRELQVCQRLLDGLTREAIAKSLGIKYRTVRQYLEQLHEKLKVNNRVALVLRVIQVRDSLIKQDAISRAMRTEGSRTKPSPSIEVISKNHFQTPQAQQSHTTKNTQVTKNSQSTNQEPDDP
jgi:DNA-binding CsgD family transcriptional regulator